MDFSVEIDRLVQKSIVTGDRDLLRKIDAELTSLRAQLAAAEAREAQLREALEGYARDLCEMGEAHECCGKLSEVECAGCAARATLQDAK